LRNIRTSSRDTSRARSAKKIIKPRGLAARKGFKESKNNE
jgi:hypothetical protein